jgi:hypothetical protein
VLLQEVVICSLQALELLIEIRNFLGALHEGGCLRFNGLCLLVELGLLSGYGCNSGRYA